MPIDTQEEPLTYDVYRVTRGDGAAVPFPGDQRNIEHAESLLRNREQHGQHPPRES